ncbi:toprim domain-containing protein [Paraflavitalea pollutisoli]|uniref:toprim domain-containing protein n=1 Tax=Paraflavitalea pollutisoli TaxID=3034143 RepID=UPI0023EC4935|nr:toprim domain-containing protein [Paraflavitalea sp. H1-2-19X]
MVDYLSSLGYKPQRISGKNYWYYSPLRDEKTPSFKINRSMNRWFDFSEGKGGNLVDFGVAYFKCTLPDFLQRLIAPGYHHSPVQQPAKSVTTSPEDTIKINLVKPIESFPLIKYLRDRRIPPKIAAEHLREVNYSLHGKNYYALGFRNDQGGYELRNQYVKASSSPKASTFINQEASSLAVFEGFFDFLSYKTITNPQNHGLTNYLILNSASFFDQQLPTMRQHDTVRLFLDNDNTGNKLTTAALLLDPKRFIDERRLYRHYNDLNAFCQHLGKSQKMQQKP